MAEKQIIKVHDKDGVYRSMAVERSTTARDVVAVFVKKLHAQGAQSNVGADQYRLFIDFPDASMYNSYLWWWCCVVGSRFLSDIFLFASLDCTVCIIPHQYLHKLT